MNTLTNPNNWVIVVATLFIITTVIVLHYETLRACITLLPRMRGNRRRRVAALIYIILTTHAVEIWLFGIAYYVLQGYEGLGVLRGAELTQLTDFVYYSAMVYTTVGFGDIVPVGPIRFMSGMEALTGFVMITWSASFTFLEMQRDWPQDDH
jgi:hypothetical protein